MKQMPMVVSVAALAGGVGLMGVLCLHLRAQVDEMETRALNAEARLASRDVVERAAQARPKVAAAASEPSAQGAAVVKDDPHALDQPQAAAKRDGKADDRLDRWIASASDPDVVRRLEQKARLQTLRTFAALFNQLQLDADKREKLTGLLAAKREVPLDVAVADFQNGGDPRNDLEAYHDMIAATRQDLESQIHALLGDADYAAYQNYGSTTAQAQVLTNLGQMLNGVQAPLTPEQETRLLESMQANNANHVTPKVITDAKEFLSPMQVQTLRDLRAIQQANSQQRNQPVQVLPATPPGGK